MATNELTGAIMRADDRDGLPPRRQATVQDVVKRLTDSRGLYEWTAVDALGWGMGPAQIDIGKAVDAAERAGFVQCKLHRGKRMVQLAPRSHRIEALRLSIARRALDGIGTAAEVRILSVTVTGSVLVVAAEQPDGYFPYTVDAFRLPSLAETDAELGDDYRCTPGEWILADQRGDFTPDAVERMVRDATKYAAVLTDAARQVVA